MLGQARLGYRLRLGFEGSNLIKVINVDTIAVHFNLVHANLVCFYLR